MDESDVKPELVSSVPVEDVFEETSSKHAEHEVNSDVDLFEENDTRLEQGQGDGNEVKLEPEDAENEVMSESDVSHDNFDMKSESDDSFDVNEEAKSDLDIFDEPEDINGSRISGARSSPGSSVVDLSAEDDEGEYSAASTELAFLRKFDMDWRFGPCIGISRLERYDRAVKNGFHPPEQVRTLIRQHEGDERYTEW